MFSTGVPPHAVVAQTIPENTLYLPLVTTSLPKACTNNLAPTPFGVQMYGDTGSSGKYYAALADSQAHWVRVEIGWSMIEPNNVAVDQYNWGPADAAVAAAKDGCLNVVLTIGSAPSWAVGSQGSPEGPLDQTKLTDFAEFLSALTERYDGDGVNDAPGSPVVNDFEMYNEPDGNDLPLVGHWGKYGAQYAQMLGVASSAIKAANPNAKIVFGGIAYDAFDDEGGQFVHSFLDDVLTAGGGNAFDVMSFHQYPAFRSRWTTGKGPGLREKAASVRQKLLDHGVNKPIIITESGWHSSNDDPNYPSSDENQSRYVVQLFTQSLASNIDMMIWWSLYDVEGFAYADGLVTNGEPLVRKPSFNVYKIMTAELGSAQYVRTLSNSETRNADMEAYQFLDANLNQPLYIAWLDPIEATGSSALRLVGSVATVRDIHGAVTTVADKDDGKVDQHVVISVPGRPVYIRITQP
ncbi:MAG: cellulase family glycosylhydrolase [Caldilineaceae bacterium]